MIPAAHSDSGEESASTRVRHELAGDLTSKDVHRLSTFLSRAFRDDPMQRWLFPRDDRRIAQIAEVMHRDITHRIPPATRLLTGGDGNSAAFVEHRMKPPSPSKSLRVAPAFLSLIGPRAVRAWRMLRLVETAHRSVGPHLYVMHLAVAEPHRDRGRASVLLDHTLTEAKQRDVGVYLETANPAALPLYARHGLVVRDEIRLPSVPPVWTLWRPPANIEPIRDDQG